MSKVMHKKQLTQKHWYPYLTLLMSCLFLFYKYIAQGYPSVMSDDLMRQFHIDATGLGSLTACYFYSFLLVQFVAGPLLDRYSPRYFNAAAILLISLSLFGFAHVHGLLLAYVMRVFMGAGVAFATVSYLKLASEWFSDRAYKVVAGLLATAASLGSMVAQVPLAFSVERHGWQTTLVYSAVLGVVLALLYALLVRDHPNKSNQHTADKSQPHAIGKHFRQLLSNKRVWLLALYSGLAWAPFAVFSGLWGNPFFQVVHHLTKTQASSLITVSLLGLATGGPLFGYLASRMKRRTPMMFVGCLLSLLSVCYVVYTPNQSWYVLVVALFVFGFGTGAFMLGFSFGKLWFPPAVFATYIALVNTGDGLFTAMGEPIVGKLLDHFWSGGVSQGVHVYSAHAYHLAMSTLPAYLFVALPLLFVIRRFE